VVEFRPERAGPRPEAVEVLLSRRAEGLYGLDLPVRLGRELGRQQPIRVGRGDHLDPAPPAAGMARHPVGPVPQRHRLGIGPEGERLAHEAPGHGGAIAIEGHSEARRHHHAPHLVRVVGLPQREQVRPLLHHQEGGDLPRHPVLALVGDGIAPGLRLGVQIGEVPERALRPEVRVEEP